MTGLKESSERKGSFVVNQIRPVIVSNGKILLFHQAKLDFPKETFWELPRVSIVDVDKPTRKEIRQEMRVQIGLVPRVGRTIERSEELASNRRGGQTRYCRLTILCSIKNSSPRVFLDREKYQDCHWVAVDDLGDYQLEEWTKVVLSERIDLGARK